MLWKRLMQCGIVCCGLTLLALWSTYRSNWVCRRCGCRSTTIDYQLPRVWVTYARRRLPVPTPLSVTVSELALVLPHEHEWVLIHGGGNGILCALGTGYDLAALSSLPQFAQFMECTDRFRGREETLHWLRSAFDERQNRALWSWLVLDFPEAGFATAAEYEAWRTRHDPLWDDLQEMH